MPAFEHKNSLWTCINKLLSCFDALDAAVVAAKNAIKLPLVRGQN